MAESLDEKLAAIVARIAEVGGRPAHVRIQPERLEMALALGLDVTFVEEPQRG